MSASLRASASRAGLYIGPTYKFSAAAAERQISLDRLCRQFALREIDEETWAKAQTDFALASTEDLQLENHDTLKKLTQNLEELARHSARLAELLGASAQATLEPDELLARAKNATNEDYAALRDDLGSLSTTFSDGLSSSNKRILAAVQGTSHLQQQLQAEVLQLRVLVKDLAPKPSSLSWKRIANLTVKFSREKPISLDGAAIGVLRRDLSRFSERDDYKIELDGYADATGGPLANLGISWARANEVQKFLAQDLKLDPSNIKVRAGGERSSGSPVNDRVVEVTVYGRLRSPVNDP
ncbi:OmpA family protein [Roseateles amylovorans]|uniref:OmpA family protein n=1 Tax=Roseateles amylovorans TaxID=2978473 RepID=A0ABY6AUN0_9BURK|nr:OmpA family protein [Roseateles amylovorans]UXH76074.1 OmpA family protein [Roseateles amylovorans]